jgi:hypothetical protein
MQEKFRQVLKAEEKKICQNQGPQEVNLIIDYGADPNYH